MSDDLTRLKARVSVEDVLIKLGAVFPNTWGITDEAPFFCPFCDDAGSSKPAGRANELVGLWHCWACNRGGDIITAVRESGIADFNDALQWLLDEFPKEVEDVDPWGSS